MLICQTFISSFQAGVFGPDSNVLGLHTHHEVSAAARRLDLIPFEMSRAVGPEGDGAGGRAWLSCLSSWMKVQLACAALLGAEE